MSLFAPAPAEALKERYGERYRWLLLMALMVGTIASIIPSTSVNVAIPAMSEYFGLGQERAQWITSAFMVASTIAMLVTPWMLSRFGYRATYTYAVLLLMVGGIVGGFAQ
ncbi:MAG: MFS transporter, partial [Comamonadaceae bacterium]|nr:MFS transporter [Comamonadaceae bacterium]